MTRAEKRKRRLVWAKTAPINAPDFEFWRHGRYVPGGCRRADGECPVWDRVRGRELTGQDLVRVRDDRLRFEIFRH